jgi:hypothetical protein
LCLFAEPQKVEKPKKVKPATPPEEKVPEKVQPPKEAPKPTPTVVNKSPETVVGTKSEFRDPDLVTMDTDALQIESKSLVVSKKRTQVVDEPNKQSNTVNFKVCGFSSEFSFFS